MAQLRTRQVKRFGWIRDLPDQRDLLFSAPMMTKAFPATVDLRRHLPSAYDQGELGSCTSNAIGAAVQFVRRKEKRYNFVPSRLFIYYNTRVIEGSVDEDSGAQIRDGIKSVVKLGVCTEKSSPAKPHDWPYDISKFKEKPPKACYDFAEDNQVIIYRRVPQILSQFKGCLAAGYPFVFGFAVYESFDSPEVARTGVASMPGPEESMLGGHAVLAVGYNEPEQRFLVRNSWGKKWGIKGYFTMPYAYLTDPYLAADFWTIRQTE